MSKKENLFFDRLRVMILLILVSSVITVMRLFDIQLIKGAQFQDMANSNRTFAHFLPRERGLILDRFGEPLVMNRALYFAATNPDQLYSKKELINRDDALRLLASNSAAVSIELQRSYVASQAGAHVLGYTGPVTAEDLEIHRELRPTDIIGKQGLEKVFEQPLRGLPAQELFEINALGKKQRLLTEIPGESGKSVSTTLDPYLLRLSQTALGNQTGAVVILDANSGEVLSLVSSPSFDPNMLTARYSDSNLEERRQTEVQAAFTHPKQLFFNRAISGSYPPGSVFKLVTALAGLSSDALDEDTEVLDEGILKVGEYSYANWYFTQYGRVEGAISLQKALARSNDIYFYKAAEWIGPNKLAENAREFGFGSQTGIELLGEAKGTVPDPIWKEETLGERWFLGNTYHFGIGQGNVLVTPLQVAQMTQAIANRGSLCTPHLIKQNKNRCTGLPVELEDLEIVVNGMIDACSAGGTAYPFFPWNETHLAERESGYNSLANGAIACKTGTAEFGATDERGYKKTHGWFTMFVNLDAVLSGRVDSDRFNSESSTESGQLVDENILQRNQWLEKLKKSEYPRNLVITVLVESDEAQPYKEGSREASPVAKAILDWMIEGNEVSKLDASTIEVPDNALAE